ncbi:hypothetical protein ACFL2X_03125 [Candidatus Latescibacterota bacterium]
METVTHAFYPLKDGASWEYRETEKEHDQNNTMTNSYTSIVDGTSELNGKTYWYTYSDDEYEEYTRIENGILYIPTPDDLVAAKIAAPATAALKHATIEVDQLPDEVAIVDLNASVGDTWEIMTNSINQQGVNISIIWTGTYVRTENVNVPAGTFNNRRKYQISLVVTSNVGNNTSTFSTSSEYWLAENVGLIKAIDVESEDGQTIFTITDELTAYSIP